MRRLVILAAALSLTACGTAPANPSDPSDLRYFEYQIPDGGTVRCLERWPNNTLGRSLTARGLSRSR